MSRILFAALLAAAGCGQGQCQTRETGRGPWVFAYFTDQNAGMRLAISTDGLLWSPVNRGEPVLPRPFPEVFRDPALSRGPDGLFRVVWTTGWNKRISMGLATSSDLLEWKDVREVPLMAATRGTRNVWAPELFFDAPRRTWIAFWASSVDGRFSETKPPVPSWNNRMYYAESTDGLRTFGAEKLFYDEGFITNDGHLLALEGDPRGRYCLAVKKVFSTPEKHGVAARIFLTFGDRPTGPFRLAGEPITGDLAFCEGPTVARVGKYYHCYFDLSRVQRMGCVRSESLKAGPWEDITSRTVFPAGARHGSVLPISRELYRRLAGYGGERTR